MPANDTAALVVALSAQLTKFEKDMDAAFGVADKGVKRIESRFAQSNSVISKEFGAVAQNAAGSLGAVGRVLTSIGPFGFAAAVALGGLALAFESAAEKVDAFAEKAKRVKEAAEVSGLTILQFRLLAQAGSKVGLDFESTQSFVERLTLGIDQLKRGGGDLFDQLLRIDTGLVRDVASAKSNAEAIDILARAYQRLQDQNQRNALAGAIGGRRNVAAGQLLSSLADQGGVKGLEEQATDAAKALSEQTIPRVAELSRQIEEIKKRTDGIWGELFGVFVLEQQKKSAETWERIALAVQKAAKFSSSVEATTSQGSAFGRRFRGVDLPYVAGSETSSLTPEQLLALGQSRTPAGSGSAELPTGITTGPQQEGARGTPRVSASVELELMRRYTSLLGEAITPSEQLRLKTLELEAAIEKGGVSNEQASRAYQAYAVALAATVVATRERFGLATQEELISVRLEQLEKARRDGVIRNAEEMVAAERLIQREVKRTAEEQEIRNAKLQGLKSLEVDARDLGKNLDTLTTTSLNNLSSALVDFATGTQTAGEAFRNFGLQVTRSIIEMVTRMLILAPIAKGLQDILGGLVTGAPLDIRPPGLRAGGGPVDAGMPYIVGERGPELFVPRGGGTIVPNDVIGRAGASDVNFTMRMDFSGYMTKEEVKQVAQSAAQRGAQMAIAVVNQNAPARQLRFSQLGT